MRASCLGACAFVILLLATSTRAAEPAERQAWLFPILRYGPNNQLRDLRRLLALAKHLERGIILTGVFRHHLDKPQHHKASIKHGSVMCFPQHNGTFIGLDRLLDRGVLEEWLPVATVAELTAQGWSGQLDALVHAKDVLHTQAHEVNRTLEVAGVRLSPNVALITTKESLKCNPTDLRDLQSKVEKHRFIGVILVQLGDSERPDSDDRTDQLESKVRVQSSTRPDVLQAPAEDRCHMAVHEANRLLQPSSWIANITLQYSQQYLGGEPYLAVHVRPYPDECMEAWRSGEFDASKPLPLSACKPELRRMHMTLGRTVRRLLTRHNLTRLLVVSHPDIRLRITQLLKPEGLVALYVDGPAVERLAGCVDGGPSFLCLVEQQLAAQAGMFLGTARSSITQNIAYLRSGAGLPSTYMK